MKSWGAGRRRRGPNLKTLRPEPVRTGPLAEWLAVCAKQGNHKSVQEIADALGVTRAHVNGLLNGTRKPSLALAIEIEDYTKLAVPAGAWGDPE